MKIFFIQKKIKNWKFVENAYLIKTKMKISHFFSAFPKYKALREIPLTDTTLNL